MICDFTGLLFNRRREAYKEMRSSCCLLSCIGEYGSKHSTYVHDFAPPGQGRHASAEAVGDLVTLERVEFHHHLLRIQSPSVHSCFRRPSSQFFLPLQHQQVSLFDPIQAPPREPADMKAKTTRGIVDGRDQAQLPTLPLSERLRLLFPSTPLCGAPCYTAAKGGSWPSGSSSGSAARLPEHT